MYLKPNNKGLLIYYILVVLIVIGLIGFAENINLSTLSAEEQISPMDTENATNHNQFSHLTESNLDCQTRAGNQTFEPFPYIEGPISEEGEFNKVSPPEDFIDFKVYNNGNEEDNFQISVHFGATDNEDFLFKKKGLNVVITFGEYTHILDPGEFSTVTIKLSIPSTIPAGTPIPINLTATSIKDPIHQNGTTREIFYVYIDVFRDVKFVSHELKPIYTLPDAKNTTLLKIRNVGNYVDNTISLAIDTSPENWDVRVDSSDIPVGGLKTNGTADIEVIIKTPKNVLESIYDIKIVVLSEKEIRDKITLQVHILKVHKIEVQCEDASKIGNVDGLITFTIIVQNQGNTNDTVDLNYSYSTNNMENMGWKLKFSENPVFLYPYESRDIVFAIYIPNDALADTNFLTLNIREGYLIKILGVSRNDTTVSADLELEIIVNPIYDFTFSKSKDTKYLILHQAQIVDYSFKIENKGNNWDLIDINYESTHQWISIPYEQRKLLPGKTEELTITFDPPPTLDADQYVFTIYGKSVTNPSQVQKLELTIEIIDADLEVTKLQIGIKDLPDAEVKAGESVLIRALITNVGDLDYNSETLAEKVSIKFMEGPNYIGETNISYLPSKRTSEDNSMWVTYPWKVGKARTYTLVVELDPYVSFPESRIENNELSGRVDVKTVPGELVDKKPKDTRVDEDNATSNIFITMSLIFILLIIINIILWFKIIKK